jgi:molybdate transport system regulatory protein
MLKINGRFWLDKDGEVYLGSGRVELLQMIEKHGSMHKAAKEMKMSYKAAWDRVNSMNSKASFPLTEKTTGGKGGGGTLLTPYAHEQIELFERFRELHSEFMSRFAAAGSDPIKLKGIMSRSFLTTSARNQMPCVVENITTDGLRGTLLLAINDEVKLRATITQKSIVDMGIEAGSHVFAIIKSTDVRVSHAMHADTNGMEYANELQGSIIKSESIDNDMEIMIAITKEVKIVAVVGKKELSKLGITDKAYISINYDDILIGI